MALQEKIITIRDCGLRYREISKKLNVFSVSNVIEKKKKMLVQQADESIAI